MHETETRSMPDEATSTASQRGQEIVVLMAAAGRRLGAAIGGRLGNAELASNVPVLVLCEIAMRGPLRPRDLLAATQMSSGGMTKQLDLLEGLGLIERAFGTIKDDRRASVVNLTPDGVRAAELIGDAVEERLEEIRVMVDRVATLLDE